MNFTEIRALAATVGFPDPDLAAAVAMAESSGNPNAMGDPQYGGSNGLWQINLPAHPEYDPLSLFDPTYNAKAALAISSNGTNWNPWTTYRKGYYLKYLPVGYGSSKKVAWGIVAVAAAGVATYLYVDRYGVPKLPRPVRKLLSA